MSGAAAVSDTRRESSSGQGRLDNDITRGSDTIMDVDIFWIACPFCTNYWKGEKNPSIMWWVIQHLLWPTAQWLLPYVSKNMGHAWFNKQTKKVIYTLHSCVRRKKLKLSLKRFQRPSTPAKAQPASEATAFNLINLYRRRIRRREKLILKRFLRPHSCLIFWFGVWWHMRY